MVLRNTSSSGRSWDRSGILGVALRGSLHSVLPACALRDAPFVVCGVSAYAECVEDVRAAYAVQRDAPCADAVRDVDCA